MMKSFSRLFFFAVVVAQILSQLYNVQPLHLISKILIVISLLIFYFTNEGRNKLFFTALFFCWLGDIFLLFDYVDQLYFMLGLGSFLIAHIILIFLYRQLKNSEGQGLNGPQKIRTAFPIILIGTGLITVLYPSLGGLKIPVMIYALALTVMVLQSIFRYRFTSPSSFWSVMIGAILFMASDSMLAIDKFSQPFSHAAILVIATYMAALYFITQGILAHSKSH